jgi:hypothetical protein
MLRHKLEDVPQETVATTTCPHHWIIEPATGPTSMGVCKLCGAAKEFSNQFKRNGLIEPALLKPHTTTTEGAGDEETSQQGPE